MLLDESVEPYMWDDNFLRAVLEQLEADPNFACQLFLWSAWIGPVQEVLLDTCIRWGRNQSLGAAGSAAAPNPHAQNA